MQDLLKRIQSFPALETIQLGPLQALWLPATAACSDSQIIDHVHPDEQKHALSLQAPQRRSEYLRARYLIRQLTQYTQPLPPQAAGEPSWPPGYRGSLTHSAGSVGLLLEPESRFLSVGIDAEPSERVHAGLQHKIINDQETKLIASLTSQQRASISEQTILTLIFSCKEAIYKCHFPIGHRQFYFHDAEVIAIDFTQRTLRVRLLIDSSHLTPKDYELDVYFAWHTSAQQSFIVTATTLPS